MFTGIIECMGVVESIREEGTNKTFTVLSPISRELKTDQSVAHNGVCLTVTHADQERHWVTAIEETLKRSNLGTLKPGDEVNLERCLRIGDRLDGHWVQGHVDTTGTCTLIETRDGSWNYHFRFTDPDEFKTVPKGSITVNGISLTVVHSEPGVFSVSIIPYTHEHTNLKNLRVGDPVNLEFDVIGKWVKSWMP